MSNRSIVAPKAELTRARALRREGGRRPEHPARPEAERALYVSAFFPMSRRQDAPANLMRSTPAYARAIAAL